MLVVQACASPGAPPSCFGVYAVSLCTSDMTNALAGNWKGGCLPVMMSKHCLGD